MCQAVGVAALASLAGFAYNTYTFLQFGVALAYSDGGCRLAAPEGMAGSEDMALGRNSLLFVTQGDLHHVFAHGAGAAKVRKPPSWPRSWANFCLLELYFHRNARANLHLLGQPDSFLA